MWEHRADAVGRLARAMVAESGPGLRALVVGRPDRRTLEALAAALGPLTLVDDPREARPGSYDVGVALEWLHRLADPEAGLAALTAAAGPHLLLAVPREPLVRLGVTLHRSGWSKPGFLRFASRHGAVHDVAHPRAETLVWVRRT